MNYLKKSLFYCLFYFIASSKQISAQVIYTDIPDATPNATYPLDLNNDSIDDFIIQMGATDKIVCFPQNDNAYAGEFIGANYFPWALTSNTNICDTLTSWYGSNNPGFLAFSSSIGNWIGQTDKYLALKLNVGTNTYYGWVRLDVVATASSFTVKDYAFESTPNACILTGQIPLDLAENSTENYLSIAPNPFHDATTIQTSGNFSTGTLTFYDVFSNVLFNQTINSSETFTFSREHLPSGIYYVSLTAENKVIGIEKLVLID